VLDCRLAHESTRAPQALRAPLDARAQYHVPAIQLLEFDNGDTLVRFCYFNHKGQFQRGPLILGKAEAARLRSSLRGCPRLRAALKKLAGS
jgi:hypothetical protein